MELNSGLMSLHLQTFTILYMSPPFLPVLIPNPYVARQLMISYFRTVLHEAVLCVARQLMISSFRTVLHEVILRAARQLIIYFFRRVLHEAARDTGLLLQDSAARGCSLCSYTQTSYFRTVLHEVALCVAAQLMISCYRTLLHKDVSV
jgi:hypothetical protein